VIPFYERFMRRFPTIAALAAAPLDDVLKLWAGLGYYARARNLWRATRGVVAEHGGELPATFDELHALPGIGRSTAGAILAQAHGQRWPILDGNVKRVLARYHAVAGWPGLPAVANELWRHAEAHTPRERVADYTQAIMDLGATVCVRSRPLCAACPVSGDCVARRDGLTAELPTPKPSREIPTRATTMLIVRDANGRVLLERRPPAGIWATLWSVPEIADARTAIATLRDRYAVRAEAPHALAAFRHTFSHYHLDVTPLVIAGIETSRVADASDRGWFARDEIAALGLPAPVRRLLQTVFEDERWREPCTA